MDGQQQLPAKDEQRTTDHDSPWKGAIEVFFRPFMELLYPEIAERIDWQVEPEFLDKELQQIVGDAELGRRYADKLVKVRFVEGAECWVLIHVEVQGKPDKTFAERMFVYYYRILDRYQKPVLSLAVLTDTHPSFRPEHYQNHLAGCGVRFDFVTAKLLDWRDRYEELLASPNVFSLLVAAQLTAKLVKSGTQRADNLAGFYRLAIAKQVDKDHIRALVNFLEWMVSLPKSLQGYYRQLTIESSEDNSMSYVSLIERWGIEEGMSQGLQQGLKQGQEQGREQGARETLQKQLKLKFGTAVAEPWLVRLEQASLEQLELWTERILFVDHIDALFAD